MSLIESTHWYVRKQGWTQGPFTRDQIRHMYASSLISRVDRVATSAAGPWLALRTVPDFIDGQDSPPPSDDAIWEIASPRFHGAQPVSYGMLQMMAAAGKLDRGDLIRRGGDAPWVHAGTFPGIFGGPRGWCTACGFEVQPDHGICQHCRARQPAYEPSMATFAFCCGIVACVWSVVAASTVVALALRRTVILGVAVDEKFPEAFAILLAPAVMCAALAVIFGRTARTAIIAGRAAPVHLPHATYGERLGWIACLALSAIVIAATAFAVAHFQSRL
jgi:hypothetical protein